MAREGIYVANKEIIERYVGERLVWRKYFYRWAMRLKISDIRYDENYLRVDFHSKKSEKTVASEEIKNAISGFYYLYLNGKFYKILVIGLQTNNVTIFFNFNDKNDLFYNTERQSQGFDEFKRSIQFKNELSLYARTRK